MTLSPCASLENKLNRAKVGLWPEHLVGKKEVVLAAKAPTTVIKAVYRGVDSLITISVIEVEQANIMCVGLQVQDEIENPFTVFQPFVTAQEHVLIEKLLSYSNFELHFFDENSRGLLATTCSFDYSLAKKAIEEVTRIRLYCLDHHRMSEFNTDFVNSILHKVNLALDIFQKDINSPMNGNPTMAIVKHIIPLSLTVLSPVPTYECGKGRFTLDETDEGRGLERTIYRLLENIYHDNTFLSPQVKEGVSQRELIDLLGFDSDSKTICLVESKVMSVLITEMSRTSKRRITYNENKIRE
jgi:hypothetical protein